MPEKLLFIHILSTLVTWTISERAGGRGGHVDTSNDISQVVVGRGWVGNDSQEVGVVLDLACGERHF